MRAISIHSLGYMVGAHIAKKVDQPDRANFLGYGAEILISGIVKLAVLFLVSAVLGIVIEAALLLAVIAVVRTLSGGAHCSAYYRCLITSVLVFTTLAYTIKTMHPFISLLPSAALAVIIILYTYLYWRYAPQAPLNKPLKNKAAETAFRCYTLIAVFILSLITLLLGTESLTSWIIAGGLLWQAFTLTPAGHGFIKFLDVLLSPGREEVKNNVEAVNKSHV